MLINELGTNSSSSDTIPYQQESTDSSELQPLPEEFIQEQEEASTNGSSSNTIPYVHTENEFTDPVINGDIKGIYSKT